MQGLLNLIGVFKKYLEDVRMLMTSLSFFMYCKVYKYTVEEYF